jgi:hypothetical protein
VLGFVTTGLLNKQIAAELGVSEITVKVHRGNVMKKLGAHSVADLVRMANTLGFQEVKHYSAFSSLSAESKRRLPGATRKDLQNCRNVRHAKTRPAGRGRLLRQTRDQKGAALASASRLL